MLKCFLLLFVCGIFITSCKDEDVSSPGLIGTWLVIHEEGFEKVGNSKHEFDFSYPDNYDPEYTDVGGYFKFDENGTCSYSLNETKNYNYVGKWALKDDKIKFEVFDGYDSNGSEYIITSVYDVLKLTSSELIIETHELDNDFDYEYYEKTIMRKVK